MCRWEESDWTSEWRGEGLVGAEWSDEVNSLEDQPRRTILN